MSVSNEVLTRTGAACAGPHLLVGQPEPRMGVVWKMALRKGKMVRMVNHGSGRVRLDSTCPPAG
jgi:predicted membrane GTPase involved in stress response